MTAHWAIATIRSPLWRPSAIMGIGMAKTLRIRAWPPGSGPDISPAAFAKPRVVRSTADALQTRQNLASAQPEGYP